MIVQTIQENEQHDRPNGLDPEKLRQFPGLDGLSDDEAVKIIADLTELSRLLYEINAIPEKYN